MLLIFGMTLIFIFGYLVSVVLIKQSNFFTRLGTSFLLGLGVFTLLMFCYSTLGIKITLSSTLSALSLGIAALLLMAKFLYREIRFDFKKLLESVSQTTRLEKIIILAIGLFCVASVAMSTYFPVYVWDALVLYDFRAKIIAQLGFFAQIANNFTYFNGYPLFTSLSHTLVYLFGGNNPQFLYSLIYISFIFVFYGSLMEFTTRKVTLVCSLILASTPMFFDHSTIAYTNLPYSVFISLGSIYLYIWVVKRKPFGYLLLSAIMSGLSIWTRSSEPFWLINIAFLIILSIYKFKRYFIPTIIYTACVFMIKEIWLTVYYGSLTTSVGNETSSVVFETNSYISMILNTPLNFQRIVDVCIFIYKNIMFSWYPLLFLFCICLLVNIKGFLKNRTSLFFSIIFLYFLLLVFGTYLFSYGSVSWMTIPDSAKRMAMFFTPMMIYYVGLTLGQKT